MKNFVDYTSRKCFANARVASPRLRNITHTRKISFSGLVIQITISVKKIVNSFQHFVGVVFRSVESL
jgi:hypothetical protein